MARIRTIKPEFWTDEKLSLLDSTARLVFLGLISYADDAGRLVDNVKLLDGQIFPNTDDTCLAALETLARLGRVHRYRSASGQQLIQVVRFSDHQKVDHPSKYVLPGPESAVLSQDTDSGADVSRKSRDELAKVSRSDLGPTTSTNDLLPTTSPTAARKKRAALAAATAFEEAWRMFPRRSGSNPKLRAQRAWSARIAEGISPDDMLAGLRRYVAHCEHEGKVGSPYVLQAGTFFGPERRYAEAWDVGANGGDPEEDRVARLVAEEEASERSTQQLIARRRGEKAVAP